MGSNTSPTGIVLGVIGGVIGGYFYGYPGAMIGASLGGLLGRLVDPPDAPKPPPFGDVTINTFNRNSVLGVCYGQCKVGGGVVMRDKGTLGWDKDGGGKNEDPTYTIKMTLGWAVAHCEGPVIGLASPPRYWVEDKQTDSGGDAEDGGVWGFELHLGTSDQPVDSYWEEIYAGQLPPPPLKYTCYSNVQGHIHGSTFSTIPSFSVELRGFLTEDGEFDANPIRVAFDWLTNGRYAIGLPLDMLNGTPDTEGSPWKETADYCDAMVAYTAGNGDTVYEPRFRYSNYIDEKIKGYDLLSDLMNSCRGILRYKNGLIEPLIESGDQVAEFYYSDRVSINLVTGGGSGVSRIYADFSAYPNIFWRGAIGRITINSETMDFGIKDQTATYIDLCLDLPGDPGVGTSFTLTKDNIKEGSFNFKELGDNDIPNVIRVEFQRRSVFDTVLQTFVNEYQWDAIEQEVPELYTWSEANIRQNIKKIKTVRYSGVKRSTQAMRMSQFLTDSIYFARWLCSFTTGIEGYQHAVGDVIGVSHIQAAWNNKWFRIIKMEEHEGDEIALDCMEYNPSVYGDLVNVGNYDPVYDDKGGSPWTPPPQIERLVAAQDFGVASGQYKFYIFFKRPDDSNYWYGAKIYYSPDGANWSYADVFSVVTPSVKLASDISYSQNTIPFDPTTLYGTFPSTGYFYIQSEKIVYTGISGNAFTGCQRGFDVSGGSQAHDWQSYNYCNLLRNETPYILTDNSFVGLNMWVKAVSFVSSGASAPVDAAPTFTFYVAEISGGGLPPGGDQGQGS